MTGNFFIEVALAQTWNSVNAGPSLYPRTMEVYKNKLYTMGESPGAIFKLYSFDETKWDSTSQGTIGYSYDFCEYQNELYCGGLFIQAGTASNSSKIARWDGVQWKSVGTGVPTSSSFVNCVAVYKGELYAGGNFTQIGGVAVNRIAKWNGTQWKDVGGGVQGAITYVTSMVVYKNELYVGGNFYKAGGKNAYYIAKWNGTQWDSIGSNGVDGQVNCMAVDTIKNILYVGGGFFNAGGVPAWFIAQWDGNQWSVPGYAITNGVLCMSMHNNELYTGGGLSDTTLARWDGFQWHKVPGPDDGIDALVVYNNNLYVGGPFESVNGDSSIKKLACYGNTCPQNVGIKKSASDVRFQVFPNPAKNEITIKAESTVNNKQYEVVIFNSLGCEMYRGKMKDEIKINTTEWENGVYLYNIEIDGVVMENKRLVLVK